MSISKAHLLADDVGEVTVVVALFERRVAVLGAEQALAVAWADGCVELLDGVLVDCPADTEQWAFRALANLPRFDALPSTFWEAYLTPTRHEGSTSEPPYPDLPRLAVAANSSGIVGFCATNWATRLGDQLAGAGGGVRSATLNASRYAQLRRPLR